MFITVGFSRVTSIWTFYSDSSRNFENYDNYVCIVEFTYDFINDALLYLKDIKINN